MDLLFLFQWLDQSALAGIAKAYGGVFAVVQMVHLLALALLGGSVLVSDFRLLGWVLADIPSHLITQSAQRVFNVALLLFFLSGIFMSSVVALKLYYNEMYWAKMIGLGIGILFVHGVRRPLLNYEHNAINPLALKALAVTSLTLWLTVAACGRWIGFS